MFITKLKIPNWIFKSSNICPRYPKNVVSIHERNMIHDWMVLKKLISKILSLFIKEDFE